MYMYILYLPFFFFLPSFLSFFLSFFLSCFLSFFLSWCVFVCVCGAFVCWCMVCGGVVCVCVCVCSVQGAGAEWTWHDMGLVAAVCKAGRALIPRVSPACARRGLHGSVAHAAQLRVASLKKGWRFFRINTHKQRRRAAGALASVTSKRVQDEADPSAPPPLLLLNPAAGLLSA